MMSFLAFGMVIDAILGEPKWIWSRIAHPIVGIGKIVSIADKLFNQAPYRKAKGTVFVFALAMFGLMAGWLLSQLGSLIEIIMIAILIAQKSLCEHVKGVAIALRSSIKEGRLAVSKIVGRDTSNLDQPQTVRAAVESAAENFSDGVIAPIFWYIIGGLPGMVIYKCVNTADSMIGYKTEKHGDFGWASAHLDDLLNWIPARLSAIILLVSSGNIFLKGWNYVASDAKLHRSPNAGWPEAAMASLLNIALAGPRSYNGVFQDFDWVNRGGNHSASPYEVERAVSLLWLAWTIMLVLVCGISLFLDGWPRFKF